ncbi:family 78 glycoside hydrolase catalytic domain [Hyunsoonleella sp. SJ7]|uniref:alpha-L-rhamnosidase n=1 Tax=Hyunsoonleella aquatilis TaxID=2762758 RepID=A0A923KG11_9FLAO|nr:alpha-L-rhamnosidase [Hyunsoonleella aquatilis]MBC3757281.1 family 78 glycoside hydrolase catalytic domain [Hyunsoonleella aquatilis]
MKKIVLIFLSIILIHSCSKKAENNISINKTTVNYFESPLGIDDANPSISWTMSSNERNKKQTAYQIKVASLKESLNTDDNILWDSGKLLSGQNSQVRYAGKALQSGQHCYFKVRVWDENDVASAWSEVNIWTMGLLKKSDWKAKWIGYKTTDKNKKDTLHLPPPPYLRKSFTTKAKIKNATLYVTALGAFEMSLNGEKIGKDLLAPGWSDYNKRIYYKTYNVTSHLTEGKNTIGAILGDAWYAGYVGPKVLSKPRNRELYGLHPGLLSQLEIEYDNGEKDIITSDESWKANEGPFIYADLLMGVAYNANLELPNWNTTNYDDTDWNPVFIHEGTEGVIQAYPGNSIQVYDEIEPIEITEPKKDTYIFNLGQNFAGHARLQVSGDKNDTIVIRFGERLHDDGRLMTENLRFARATDTYILKGEGTEIWEPKFTYHGFQYVEVTGLKAKPNKKTITGIPFGSSIPFESSFTSSDEVLNKMYQNVLWTQHSNFMEVPTDSPQRDERLGWLGDVQIFSRSALYNANIGAFNAKWFADVRDAQYDNGLYAVFAPRPYPKLVWFSPGWMEAGVMVPYNTYKFYNDTKVIENHYESMTRFMDYHIEKSKVDKFYPEHSWPEARPEGGFGDWLSMTEKHLSHDILASMHYQYALKIMSEMSGAIGKQEKADYYKALYNESVSAFIKHYIDEDGKFQIDEAVYGEAKGYFEGERGFTGHTQSAYATAIYFDLLPPELKEKAGKHLVDLLAENNNLPSSGILGIRQLLPALSSIGRSDLAYEILLKKDYPSWGFQVKNGATTIWERWNSYTPEDGFNGEMNAKMNSFNHYAFGAFSQFLFSDIAGINTKGAGFNDIVIKPKLGNMTLTDVNAKYASINGDIVSSWSIDGSNFNLKVEIPVNTKASVYIPSKEGSVVSESGSEIDSKLIKFVKQEGDYKVYEIGSGSYKFQSEI